MISYCAFTWGILYFNQEWVKKIYIPLLIICVPYIFFLVTIHIRSFSKTQISLLSSQAYWLGTIFGIGYYFSGRYMRALILGILLLLNVWVVARGYEMWIHYVNFGSASGRVSMELPAIQLLTQQGVMVGNNDLLNKITVLDFWNLRCGICFEKFPVFQAKHEIYSNNPEVQFIAVNIPFKTDRPGKAFSELSELGYTFSSTVALDRGIIKPLGIWGFPTVLIVNRANRVIFRGSIEKIDKVLREELAK